MLMGEKLEMADETKLLNTRSSCVVLFKPGLGDELLNR